MKKIGTHYALGIALALLVSLVGYVFTLIPGIGYGILTVLYVLILFAQGAFYGLTAIHGTAWSTISFVVNFVLWVTELVQLEQLLEGSSVYKVLYKDQHWLIYGIGGALWATNKLVLDLTIERVIAKRKLSSSRLEA